MSADLFLEKPDSSAIATFAEFQKVLLDAYPETIVSDKVFSVIQDGEHLADIYCHDNTKDPEIVQWINVNGRDFGDLPDFLISTFGVDDAELLEKERSEKKSSKKGSKKKAGKSIKTLEAGASGLFNGGWNESWLEKAGTALRLKLKDGSFEPAYPTSLGDFYGFKFHRSQKMFCCYSPERDLYFVVMAAEFTPAVISEIEAILPREELRLAEYIEAARVGARFEFDTKLTGARFAGLEIDYGDLQDGQPQIALSLNVTHEPGPGYSSSDCFKVVLPREPGEEADFGTGYIAPSSLVS